MKSHSRDPEIELKKLYSSRLSKQAVGKKMHAKQSMPSVGRKLLPLLKKLDAKKNSLN
jgi:hypothetical protein